MDKTFGKKDNINQKFQEIGYNCYLLDREDDSTVATRLDIRRFAVFPHKFGELTSHSPQVHEEGNKFTRLNTRSSI